MKRRIIIVLLISIVATLSATGKQLSIISAEKGINTLQWVRSREQASASIYYYNEDYIIAAIDADKDARYEYPGNPVGSEKLYLIDSPDAQQAKELQQLGRTTILPGGDILLVSEAKEPELRAKCRAPFVNLLHHPIQVQDKGFGYNEKQELRTELAQMTQMVSADSVAAFIQSLQDMQTRYAYANNRLEVATWIKDTFQRFGISNAHLEEFSWDGTQQYNVVATIEGSLYPDEYVVVGGHHDSITYTDPMSFAPGADDNASGTVAAIETARVLMQAAYQPKCSIRFVTFAAEEFGLHGSHYNAQSSLDLGENIRLMINHDMIANNPNNLETVRLMPYDGSMEQSEYASLLVSDYSFLSANFGSMNSHSSDSYSYWSRGIPVIYFFEEEFSPVYHSDEDTFANLNPAYCAEVIKGSLACSVSFANMPAVVSHLDVRDHGDGSSLLITWQEPADPDIDHVLVFIGTGDPTQNEPIAVYDNNSYLATGLAEGQLYNIAVSTVDSWGNQSYRIFGTGIPYSIPMVPQALNAHPIRNAVQISWKANDECDLAGYTLYRATNPDASYSILAQPADSDTTYTDNDVLGNPEQLYFYKLQAIDDDGNPSPVSEAMVARPVSLNNGVLIVDESGDGSGTHPFLPTGEMVNQFYAQATAELRTGNLDIEELNRDLELYDICIYSSVLWHNTDLYDADYPYAIRDMLKEYVALGGNLLYTGYSPTKAFELNAGYPVYFGADTFINSVLGISGANFSNLARFNGAISQVDELDHFTIDPDKTLPAYEGHINRVETLYPAPGAQVWYSYGSNYDPDTAYGEFQGEAVAIYNEHGLGKSAIFSFPIYATSPGPQIVQILHTMFGESVSNDDPLAPVSPGLQISGNYPNPFFQNTSLFVKGTGDGFLRMKIYNLRGQLVRTLDATKSGEYDWDGKDDTGRTVSSGIYFARIRDGGKTAQRKMLKLK